MTKTELNKYILRNFKGAYKFQTKWMNLLSYCLLDLFAFGCEVNLHNTVYLHGCEKEQTGGEFSGDNEPNHLYLNCSTGSEKHSFREFVHEYSHFCQWKAHFRQIRFCQCKLHFSKIKPFFLDDSLNLIVELDCEKRGAELLKRFHISKSFIDHYIREANLYIFSIAYEEKFCCEHSGKISPEVRKQIKTTFYENYRIIPPVLLKEFKRTQT